MKLEGEVLVNYRGVPDHGRDWLERSYFPRLTGPGFVAVLALGVSVLNATVILVPLGKIYLALCAGAVVGSLATTTPFRATEKYWGPIVPVAVDSLQFDDFHPTRFEAHRLPAAPFTLAPVDERFKRPAIGRGL